nr:zinc ribbon domain-containing protein [Pyrinomonadaceae bacterium]
MICPKCNSSNNDEYTFCLECGAELSKNTDVSSEPPPTVAFTPGQFPRTEIMPPQEIPPTVQYSNPQNTREQQNSPTKPIEVPPTVLFTLDKTSSPTQQSNPQFSAAQQYVPAESVESTVSPKLKSEESETAPKTHRKSKKSRNFFLIAGIFLLLLLVGGGVAVYFFAQPMQADKSYVLTDKHEAKDNILSFDNQNNAFIRVGTDKDGFQRWQITPDPADKNFYRFVNRGVGEGESLEVVDDNYDSSVSMARSAIDQG